MFPAVMITVLCREMSGNYTGGEIEEAGFEVVKSIKKIEVSRIESGWMWTKLVFTAVLIIAKFSLTQIPLLCVSFIL